jgi:hypothetical protein
MMKSVIYFTVLDNVDSDSLQENEMENIYQIMKLVPQSFMLESYWILWNIYTHIFSYKYVN